MKSKVLYLSLVFICVAINFSSANGIKITFKQGELMGKEESSYQGRPYFAFRNIPFAQPPVQELRFKPPKPVWEWNGVFDARNEGEVCAQAALGFKEGVEDCLHLSVFTPKVPKEEGNGTLPVLVWLHGGSFVIGSGNEYSPHLIMDRDVVVVIPQYRLGALGFYSSNSKHAPGNYGLLDQLTALKWVQQNVDKFGGDPKKVTLGGDCAGGVSSVLHMMSPLSKGLFHRVISLSGSPLSTWAIHPKHNRLGLMLSNKLNCPPHDFKMGIECFRKTPIEKLLESQKYILETSDLLVGNKRLAPVVQNAENCEPSTHFLRDHPLKLLLEENFTKVPVLLGVTRDVGSYLVDMGLYDRLVDMKEENPKFFEETFLNILRDIDIRDAEGYERKFKKFYTPKWDNKIIDHSVPGLTKLFGDSVYNAAIISLAKILSKNVETHMLRFDYEGGPKLYDLRHEDRTEKHPPILSSAVSHGDEMYFLFPLERNELTKDQEKVVQHFLNIVDDFVNEREPLNSWPLFTENELETTVITKDGNVEKGVRFTSEENEKFLQFITESHHFDILEKMNKNLKAKFRKLKHDEL